MPNLSNRAKDAFASPFRKFIPLAQQAKARGTDVIHLNIGQPDFLMPAGSLQNIADAYRDYIPYGQAEGQAALRHVWCKYYRRFDIDLDADQLLITSGASEGIFLTLLSIADAGDEIIIPEPFYANYNGFCQMAHVKIKPLFSTIEEGFPIPKISKFEAAISSKTKAILLSNPNNPSGKVYDRQTIFDLVNLAKKHDLFLIVDEAYSEFLYEEFQFTSALTVDCAPDHIIVVDSISKRFNACGVRVGAVATRNSRIIKSIIKFARMRLSPPMLGQTYAINALQSPRQYHVDLRKEFTKRRNLILQRLGQMPEVQFHAPEGAFYTFVKLPIDDSDQFCSWLLTDFSQKGYTVMLAPGTGFYATPGQGRDQVRIAYVLENSRLEIAMDCLQRALQVYPGVLKRQNITTL